MTKCSPSLFIFLFFLSVSVNAQYNGAPNALAFRWTLNNFQFPLNDYQINKNDYTSGAELTYIRHIGKYLNLAFPLKIGQAGLPLDEQGNADPEELIGSFDALLHLKLHKPGKFFYPYLLGGAGLMAEVENDWQLNPEFPVGLGFNFRLAPHFFLSIETQYRFDLSDNRNQLQHAAGVWFVLGGTPKQQVTDSDKDGISDNEDQCPHQPGPPQLFGCPDTDGDGVADRLDDCPDEPGPAQLRGCPDRDDDGVPDRNDACPDEPGLPERNGCPINDRDHDGVEDENDRCPDLPGFIRTDGCPDGDNDGLADPDDRCPTIAGLPSMRGCPDTDGDGLSDPDDRCPNTPGPVSNKGCPELRPEEKEILAFAMKAVQFETGSARLLATSNKILDEIVGIMKKYPEQKLRISGHTDSIGSFEENQLLSERRAKACFDYLVSKGISSSRITHQGFGERNPIADNRFAAGREQNRRVEFEVYVE